MACSRRMRRWTPCFLATHSPNAALCTRYYNLLLSYLILLAQHAPHSAPHKYKYKSVALPSFCFFLNLGKPVSDMVGGGKLGVSK